MVLQWTGFAGFDLGVVTRLHGWWEQEQRA